ELTTTVSGKTAQLLQAVIDKATAKDPGQRYQSINEFALALSAATGAPAQITEGQPSTSDPGKRWYIPVGALLVGLTAVFAATMFWSSAHQAPGNKIGGTGGIKADVKKTGSPTGVVDSDQYPGILLHASPATVLA